MGPHLLSTLFSERSSKYPFHRKEDTPLLFSIGVKTETFNSTGLQCRPWPSLLHPLKGLIPVSVVTSTSHLVIFPRPKRYYDSRCFSGVELWMGWKHERGYQSLMISVTLNHKRQYTYIFVKLTIFNNTMVKTINSRPSNPQPKQSINIDINTRTSVYRGTKYSYLLLTYKVTFT